MLSPLIINNIGASDNRTKVLPSIHQNILDMKESTRYIDEKLDCINHKVNQTVFNVELYQETLMKPLPTLVSLTDEVI